MATLNLWEVLPLKMSPRSTKDQPCEPTREKVGAPTQRGRFKHRALAQLGFGRCGGGCRIHHPSSPRMVFYMKAYWGEGAPEQVSKLLHWTHV
jgi:hypothetical protein